MLTPSNEGVKMGLRIIPTTAEGNHHGFRPCFYAQYRDRNGHVTTKKLETKLKGVPPPSGLLKDEGNPAFEKAKGAAEQELAEFLKDNRDAKTATAKYCANVRNATGQTIADMELNGLAKWYRAHEQIRETDANADWLDWKDGIIDDFAVWARAHRCRTAFAVTPELAQEYCAEIANTLSRETLKKKVYRLAGAFRAFLPGEMKNPFEGAFKIATNALPKTVANIHRAPMDENEIRALWTEARKAGSMWYGLAVCAACTGMRIGDVCNLQWRNVDLRNGLLTDVPTAKTGVNVTLPLFDYEPDAENYHPLLGELRRVLDGANTDAAGKDPVYVFPDAHAQYMADKDVIYTHGKFLFAAALFGNAEPEPEDANREPMTPDAIKQAIAAAPWCEKKRTRIMDCYTRIANGETYAQIKAAMNYDALNRVSMDLAEVERMTGERIRPRATGAAHTKRALLDRTRQSAKGRRAASIYGWHSLRHAYVVLAVNGGVPIETVQTLVGHATVKMTMEYFNPTAKQAADAMRRKLRENRAARGQVDGNALAALLNALPVETRNALLQQAQAAALTVAK